MKLIPIVLLISLTVYSQNFKEVNSAQDVIDNYIIANGGEDNLRKIKSVKIDATMESEGVTVPLTMYVSRRYYYFYLSLTGFDFGSAVDLKNKKGWSRMANLISDLTEENYRNTKQNAQAMMWEYYIDKDKHGISYRLLPEEEVNGTKTYVVEFIKSDEAFLTVYFDATTFHRLKQIKEGIETTYSDYRKISSAGLYAPYTITSDRGVVKVNQYTLNEKFDKSLLNKPKIDSED